MRNERSIPGRTRSEAMKRNSESKPYSSLRRVAGTLAVIALLVFTPTSCKKKEGAGKRTRAGDPNGGQRVLWGFCGQ